jgi:hypothetical protein
MLLLAVFNSLSPVNGKLMARKQKSHAAASKAQVALDAQGRHDD